MINDGVGKGRVGGVMGGVVWEVMIGCVKEGEVR